MDFRRRADTGLQPLFHPRNVDVLNGDEILLDAGAHHGSVIEGFRAAYEWPFRPIVAIEPDPANRARLEKFAVRAAGRSRAYAAYDFALAERRRAALFHGGLDDASQLSPTGTCASRRARSIPSNGRRLS